MNVSFHLSNYSRFFVRAVCHTFVYLLMFGLCCGLSACRQRETLVLATGAELSPHFAVGRELQAVVGKQTDIELHLLTEGEGSRSNCALLAMGEADLALAQNDVALSFDASQVRTIMPLYPQVLFIIYDPRLKPASLAELIRGRRVGVGPRTGGTVVFVERLFEHYGIRPDEYQVVYSSYPENVLSDSVPVTVSLTGYNTHTVRDMVSMRKGEIWSLDEPALLGQGSSVEGFCLNYPLSRPFVVPRLSFRGVPEKPVLSVMVWNVLLATTHMSDEQAGRLVRAISENKGRLALEDPLFHYLPPDIESEPFQFPLHQGTLQYIRRDEPGFLERNSGVIGIIFTIVSVLYAGFVGLVRLHRARQRDRIDRYYRSVIEVEQEAHSTESVENLIALKERLFSLKKRAFKQMADQKLEPDDSFRIFITQIQDSLRVLNEKLRQNSNT